MFCKYSDEYMSLRDRGLSWVEVNAVGGRMDFGVPLATHRSADIQRSMPNCNNVDFDIALLHSFCIRSHLRTLRARVDTEIIERHLRLVRLEAVPLEDALEVVVEDCEMPRHLGTRFTVFGPEMRK